MKILTFNLNTEVYAVPASNVISISQVTPISPLPLAAEYILGVVYLRGQVVNILDVKLLFKLKPLASAASLQKDACLVYLEHAGSLFGFLVDSVRDVIDVEDATLTEQTPPSGNAASYVDSILKIKTDLVFLISASKLSQTLELNTTNIKAA